jgi:hypothetical protein
MVGVVEWYDYDIDENELYFTIGVAADTISSQQEQDALDTNGSQNFNPNATNLINSIGDSVDAWASENGSGFSGLDVYPAFITGNATDTYGPVALPKTDPAVVALKEARQAKNVAQRAANVSAGRVGYTPKSKR